MHLEDENALNIHLYESNSAGAHAVTRYSDIPAVFNDWWSKKVFKIRQRFQQFRIISQVTHDASGPGSECPPKVSAVFVFGATFREKSDFIFIFCSLK